MSYNLILTKYLNHNGVSQTRSCCHSQMQTNLSYSNPFNYGGCCYGGQSTYQQPSVVVLGGVGYQDMNVDTSSSYKSSTSSSFIKGASMIAQGLATAGHVVADIIYASKGYPERVHNYESYTPQRHSYSPYQSSYTIVSSSSSLCSCNSAFAATRYIPTESSYISNLDLYLPFSGYSSISSGYGANLKSQPSAILDYQTVQVAKNLNFSSAGMYDIMSSL